ncbi:MAG: tetratricopeptide repeat protein [bacterium]
MSAFERACELESQLLRGDHIIGLLPGDSVDTLIELFESSDNPLAHEHLGHLYADGALVAQDVERAIAHYSKAAEISDNSALCRLRLAYFFAPEQIDSFVESDLERLLAADPNGDAHLIAGYMSQKGVGLPLDLEAAHAYHTKSAEVGNAQAMFELHILYVTGAGVEVDEDMARHWCVKAAEAGSRRAMNNLGSAYATGTMGVARDPEEAVKWYEKAFEHGHAQAGAVLGVMYFTGDGVDFDEEKSNDYFDRAQAMGFDVDGFLKHLGFLD